MQIFDRSARKRTFFSRNIVVSEIAYNWHLNIIRGVWSSRVTRERVLDDYLTLSLKLPFAISRENVRTFREGNYYLCMYIYIYVYVYVYLYEIKKIEKDIGRDRNCVRYEVK